MLGKYHTIYLEATRKCNFSCQHCSSGSNRDHYELELSTDEIIFRVLKPSFNLGARYIEFSGGEFLLRRDAYELLSEANNLGYRIGIASNGSTLNDKTIKKLKDILDDNLLISLGVNSFDCENIETRDVEPDYTMKVIRKLEEANINMNICVTMGSFNAESFGKTLSAIQQMHLPHNRIPYVPRNSDNKENMFDKDILRYKLHPVLRKYYHGYVSYVPFFLDPKYYHEISGQQEKEYNVPTNPSIGCWCGSFFAVNPVGEVAPCPLLADHVSGGNIRESSIEEILYHSELFKRIIERDEFEGKCGACKYRFTCGGCRAITYYQTGNLYGSDPTCFIEDLSEAELEEMETEIKKHFKNYVRMAKFGGLYDIPDRG